MMINSTACYFNHVRSGGMQYSLLLAKTNPQDTNNNEYGA